MATHSFASGEVAVKGKEALFAHQAFGIRGLTKHAAGTKLAVLMGNPAPSCAPFLIASSRNPLEV